MTIKDLQTGDIVVLRNGALGFYVNKENEGYILYADSGYDCVDNFNDDMTDYANGPDFDIMRVYRLTGGFIYFNDYWDGDLIFNREADWVVPTT